MEAQPLVLPNVKTDFGTRDILLLPSMANVVRGVDAHDGSGIWQTNLGVPINGSRRIDSHNINQHWGCISTGAIDPDTKQLLCPVHSQSLDPQSRILITREGYDVMHPPNV